MKYLVNPQGRGVCIDDNKLPELLQRGFIEITKSQFVPGKVYTEFVSGHQNTPQAVTQVKKTTDREVLPTKIV